MKGIILAGGNGNRLYPASLIRSKQLITIYDKPMIYYPLSLLMLLGIKDILIVTTYEDRQFYEKLLSDGSQLGIGISYAEQKNPRGIAEAVLIGKEFIAGDDFILILGDNILYGRLDPIRQVLDRNPGATVFGYYVNDPERYGVIEYDRQGNVTALREKPDKPGSNYAAIGLYVYQADAVSKAGRLTPSLRGELEITDLNMLYLQENRLQVQLLGRGIAWFDTGTPQSLLDASSFIGAIEQKQGLKVGCIEEVAYMMNFIDHNQLKKIIGQIPDSEYRDYLRKILKDRILHRKYQDSKKI